MAKRKGAKKNKKKNKGYVGSNASGKKRTRFLAHKLIKKARKMAKVTKVRQLHK